MDIESKIIDVKNHYKNIEKQLAVADGSSQEFIDMSKEYAELKPVVDIIDEYLTQKENFKQAEEMLNDPEMKDLAENEYYELKEKLPEIEQRLKVALLPKDKNDTRNIILEIRPGTGGDESTLFAKDLFEMYRKYAELKGWNIEVMSVHENGIGGYKEIVANIKGTNVYERMKYESGTHRVQRVPETESQGRVHTSAVTVAVMPEAEDVDVEINPADLEVETCRSSGAGGQHVNTTDSAVKILHKPTGIVAQSQEERSQHKNKAKAMKMLKTKIYNEMMKKQHEEIAATRKSQVGSGDRSEKIRTYNFPQSRVTDHRVNLTLYEIDDIMEGKSLDKVIDALNTQDQLDRLAEL
jgi:peptide chain release factor 1